MPDHTEERPHSSVVLRVDDRGDRGRIARITFDNQAKRNALALRDKNHFIELMTGLRHDGSLRAVVITGAGEKSFVAGTDLAEMTGFDQAAAESSATRTHRMCDAVRTCPVPVIARINGDCFGSGMELAACADLRVGVEHARFGMPETRFGIPSGMEAAVLPKLVGWGKAVELVLTGDHIDAREAHRIGYLQRPRALRRAGRRGRGMARVAPRVRAARGAHPEAPRHRLGPHGHDRRRARGRPGLRRRVFHRRAPAHDGSIPRAPRWRRVVDAKLPRRFSPLPSGERVG